MKVEDKFTEQIIDSIIELVNESFITQSCEFGSPEDYVPKFIKLNNAGEYKFMDGGNPIKLKIVIIED